MAKLFFAHYYVLNNSGYFEYRNTSCAKEPLETVSIVKKIGRNCQIVHVNIRFDN